MTVAAHLDRVHMKGLAPPRPSTMSQDNPSFWPSGSSVTVPMTYNGPHHNFSNSLVSSTDFSLGSKFFSMQDATKSESDDANQESVVVCLADHIQSARHNRIRPSSSHRRRSPSSSSPYLGHGASPRLDTLVSTQVCSACGKIAKRRQDMHRHIQLAHLPCWIFCPHSGCTWRGTRMDALERHWEKQKCGSKSEGSQCRIYNTKLALSWSEDLTSADAVSTAQNIAVDLVKERALELGRQEWLKDPWGFSPPETRHQEESTLIISTG